MKRLGQYLKDTITVVKVTLSSGDRTEVQVPGIKCAIFKNRVFVRSPAGDYYEDKTFIGLPYDTDITMQDDVIVNSVQRPVKDITPVRESRHSSAIDHIEVEIG